MMNNQYIPIFDEVGIALFGKLCPDIKFLRVSATSIEGDTTKVLLSSPLPEQETTHEKTIEQKNTSVLE